METFRLPEHTALMQRLAEDYTLPPHTTSGIRPEFCTFPQPLLDSSATITTLNCCDANSPAARRLASDLHATTSDKTFVEVAFAWVRDQVWYTHLENWALPVEHTLARRRGMCSSCLLVALLRAAGLDAGFLVETANLREVAFTVWVLGIHCRYRRVLLLLLLRMILVYC